jgi:succinylglutamate desuccinylase
VIETLLQQFRALADRGPFEYEWCHHTTGSGEHTQHTVIGCLIHGNENGTLPAAIRLVEALTLGTVRPKGPVTVLIGNTAAALADKRFLEEDFNRVFTFDRPATSIERKLAERVRPILDAADVFLDLHQTQTPTERAFWTFPWSQQMGLWARALQAANVALTRPAGQSFSAGTCCLDEYVRNRDKVGITVELGYKGQDPAQAGLAFDVMTRLITLVDDLSCGVTTLDAAARKAPEVSAYKTAAIVPAASAQHRLRPGLGNWTAVKQGELLSAEGAPEIRASVQGFVLFPKYPAPTDPPPSELFRLAQYVADVRELED